MPDDTAPRSRREERRAEIEAEIKTLAMEQVVAGGADAVSVNAVARSMGMSPAALYRYFDSRDALLATLVVEAYDSLADALEAAAASVHDPRARAVAVMAATRTWALARPNAYRLIFASASDSGRELDPASTVPAATRSMSALLAALARLGPAASAEPTTAGPAPPPALREEVEQWAERAGATQLSAPVLTLGLLAWTRLHGVISLELGHHLSAMGLDAATVYAAEVDTLVDQAVTG